MKERRGATAALPNLVPPHEAFRIALISSSLFILLRPGMSSSFARS
jgi:hypothetical protein